MYKSHNDQNRRQMLVALGAVVTGSLFINWDAHAQAYPSRPITIVVPFAPGGPTDSSARVIGRAMATSLGQPVIVENRPGAGGIVGSTQVAQADPDGYTLLWGGTSSLAVAPALHPDVKFHPETSFIPIGLATLGSMVLAAKPDFPANSAKELVAYGQNHEIKMGNGGQGSLAHLAAESFRELTDIKMVNVPYRGGGPALTDLLGGVLDAAFDNASFLAQHIQAGKLKPLAVTGRERHQSFPDVPTVAETFGGDFEVYSWFGLFAPAGTPDAIVNTLDTAMAKASSEPEVKKSLEAAGLEPAAISQADAARTVATDHKKWAEIIRRADVVGG